MIDYLWLIPTLFILGIYFASIYKYYREEEEKRNKRKCRLDKYNR